MISLIVAHDRHLVIGYDNKMPWHLPGDLRYFKEQTMGKPVVMGRKTFESIGRPLPGRRNIVITRNPTYGAEGIETVHSLDEALALVRGVPEVMIIGGEEIFRLAMSLADRLYITKIDHTFVGDTYFPAYEHDFREVYAQEKVLADQGYDFQYIVFERKES